MKINKSEKVKIIFYILIVTTLSVTGFFVLNKIDFSQHIDNKKIEQNILNNQQNIIKTSVQDNLIEQFDESLKVPILMYHHIRDINSTSSMIGASTTDYSSANLYSVTPEYFEKQIKWLTDNGYQSISLKDALYYFKKEVKFYKKPVVLTFDDGYEDAYTVAMPILKKYDQIGIFYIPSGKLGQKDWMTEEQVKLMDQGGMIVGAHTISHPHLRELSPAVARKELLDSKLSLEKLLGHEIADFAYPYGQYSENILSLVKSLGYDTAVTVKPEVATTKFNFWELPRIRINDDTDLSKILK